MDKKNIKDIYKLSPNQYGLLFNTLYALESGIFIEQAVSSFQDLNVPHYIQAWQKVIERHPILRTAFYWEDLDEPLQVVMRQVQLPVERRDWCELDRTEQQKRLQDFLETDRRRGFDLSTAPLMRLTLIRWDEKTFSVVWTYHHILLDGWSVVLVSQELKAWLEAFEEGRALDLPEPRPFRDYISWLQKKDWEIEKGFWRQKLEGLTTATPLSVDAAPGSLPDLETAVGKQEIDLSDAVTAATHAFTRQHHLTIHTLVQAAWALLLYRYGGEKDVVFGVTVHGRPTGLSGIESIVGLFINVLPVRVRLPSTGSVLDWLSTVQVEFTELLRYGYTPLVQIQGWNGIPRNKPMFDYVLVNQSDPIATPDDQDAQPYELFEITGYPLTLYLEARDDTLKLQIAYDSQRFDDDAITRMLHHLHTLLSGMIGDPNRPLAELSLLTADETQRILSAWNDTTAPWPKNVTLQQLFTLQAAQTPQATAVIYGDERLTYAELDARANQLAHYLRARGVGPDTRVGLCVERSLDMIVALWGILKVGGAYVPLDPAYPGQRLAFVLQDAQIELLLTHADLASRLPQLDVAVLYLDRDRQAIAHESTANPADLTGPDSLAYVIYTSGSTGQPKGVAVSQQALVHYVTAAGDHFAITPGDRVLQFASISFDTAAEEIYPCLLGGATLVLRTDAMLTSVETFLRTCAAQDITVLDLPTAYWHAIAAELDQNPLPFPPSLRLVIIGGEAALPERLQAWLAHVPARVRLINTYGPTEATIVATTWDLTEKNVQEGAARVPIGKPIANTRVYVLNPQLQPMPVGVPGELYIGGVGLAQGYLNRSDLTAAAFVPNPFLSPEGDEKGGARLYKTGDLARYLPGGELEFWGRGDQQVKIRGFRVELGEIESVLSQHPAVRETAVSSNEDIPGNKRLVAYVVSNPQQAAPTDALRGFLKERLPDYMLPSIFVALDALPLTPSGKVDRRALPAPERARPDLGKALVAPRTLSEKTLAEIWAEALGVNQVGIYDDFFELGGHSMLVPQIVTRIQNAFQVKLSLPDLFEQPTIAELAVTIEEILLEEIDDLSEEETWRLMEGEF